mmetsp:Transcript_58535/g.171249  ORF Transcript_58535/g.171249 Transcript_58535/m.171249 type:complete len:204 (-) Transcript_58535:390-1001(-)
MGQLAKAYHVNVLAEIVDEILRRHAAAHLDCEPVREALLQLSCSCLRLLGREIVEHDNLGPSPSSLESLLHGLAFHLNLVGEATDTACLLNHGLDGTAAGPDMVVLQHGHVTEVHPVWHAATDDRRVLLHKTEARRDLPCRRYLPVPSFAQLHIHQRARLCGDAAGPREDVQRCPLPLQKAMHRPADRGDMVPALEVIVRGIV